MKFAIAIVTTVLVAFPFTAIGQDDHLFPEPTLLSSARQKEPPRLDADYNITVATVFRDAFADDTVLYADADNPLGGIWFVGLKRIKDDWRIFSLSEDVRLLRYAEIAEAEREGDAQTAREYRSEVPLKPEDVPLMRCEKPLDAALAQRLSALWDTMLRAARYTSLPEIQAENKRVAGSGGISSVLVDGTAFHFYTKGMVGQTYNPDAGTAPDLLSKIADTMFQACADSKSLPALRTAVETLEKHLATEHLQ